VVALNHHHAHDFVTRNAAEDIDDRLSVVNHRCSFRAFGRAQFYRSRPSLGENHLVKMKKPVSGNGRFPEPIEADRCPDRKERRFNCNEAAGPPLKKKRIGAQV